MVTCPTFSVFAPQKGVHNDNIRIFKQKMKWIITVKKTCTWIRKIRGLGAAIRRIKIVEEG